ncbi:response regulator [Thauera sp. 27]|uniref:response regulator n=1 Tax=Thauera sp. 27 TaxID=305700 RepID=UPI00056D9899|nr:response regulator [Thauera sp. 27]
MRVLIVDDNPINRLLPGAWITRSGWDAVECPNGVEALKKLSTERFDVILLDLSMPGLSGIEVCRRLRALPNGKGVRVIAYTAHAVPDALEGLTAAGFDEVLIKPITKEGLMRVVTDE